MTPTNRQPVATYRIQLGPRFGFADVIEQLDHLAALGVSHLYLSPIAEAVPGSTHGYDVVDHARVRDELGGADGLAALFDAAAAHGLAVLFDHVPNHVSTARPALVAAWWEMLRDGPDAPGARWFDVDRDGPDPRVVLPVLGEPLDAALAAGHVELDRAVDPPELVLYGAYRLPLAAGTADLPLAELLDAQHYRLVWWRSPERNVRRFFTIDDLVAVRVEHPEVADVVDTLPARWADHPAFAGVRVDHVDGLADPEMYLTRLREIVGDGHWLLVEKILAPDEWLPPSWPVDGTTGYEFSRVVDHLLVDPAAEPELDRLWHAASGDERPYHEVEDEARREVLAGPLRPDLERTVAAARRAVGDRDDLDAVVLELTARLPRYRTYLPHDPAGDAVLRATAAQVVDALPDAGATVDGLVDALVAPSSPEDERFRTRWQQLTGPAMAKGAEDRAFYRYLRLASLCEVGGEPGVLGSSIEAFHEHQREAHRRAPLALLAGTTHDTKRSGDVRSRSAALTDVVEDWTVVAAGWSSALRRAHPGLDGASVLHALQTVVTCPGLDSHRLHEFLVKSAREAGLRTSWADPDEEHERLLGELAVAVVDGPGPADDIADWATRLDAPGRARSLAQTLLRLTCPGVPDVYQGTELFRYRLVDPDNRVPPDRGELRRVVDRAGALDGPAAWRDDPDAARAVVYRRTLALRRRRPAAFGPGGEYDALTPEGAAAGRAVAFCRGGAVVTVAAIRWTAADQWGDTSLLLPPGRWSDVLVDDGPERSGAVELAELLAGFPVALLERLD